MLVEHPARRDHVVRHTLVREAITKELELLLLREMGHGYLILFRELVKRFLQPRRQPLAQSPVLQLSLLTAVFTSPHLHPLLLLCEWGLRIGVPGAKAAVVRVVPFPSRLRTIAPAHYRLLAIVAAPPLPPHLRLINPLDQVRRAHGPHTSTCLNACHRLLLLAQLVRRLPLAGRRLDRHCSAPLLVLAAASRPLLLARMLCTQNYILSWLMQPSLCAPHHIWKCVRAATPRIVLCRVGGRIAKEAASAVKAAAVKPTQDVDILCGLGCVGPHVDELEQAVVELGTPEVAHAVRLLLPRLLDEVCQRRFVPTL